MRLTQADVQIRDTAGDPGTVNIDANSEAIAEAKNDGLAASLARGRERRCQPTAKLVGQHARLHRPAHHLLAGGRRHPRQGHVAKAKADVDRAPAPRSPSP